MEDEFYTKDEIRDRLTKQAKQLKHNVYMFDKWNGVGGKNCNLQVRRGDNWLDFGNYEYPVFGDESIYRVKPEQEYKPFPDDFDGSALVGKVIKAKVSGNCHVITSYITSCDNLHLIIAGRGFSYKELFTDYTYLDGTPFGVEE